MKTLLLSALLIINSCVIAQTHVNREWISSMGDPDTLEWSASITNDSSEMYHVGNTKMVGEGTNLLITKYDNTGAILWQEDFNTSVSNNDYGIAVDIDTSDNVYVLGATDNNSLHAYDYDYILLKYSSTGTLIWDKQFDSGYNLRDVGTSLTVADDGQDIYAAVTSESSFQNFDFLTVRFDGSGDTLWTRRYDHNDMMEIPVGIDVSGARVRVIGASAESTSEWDYTLVSYDTVDGDLGVERREVYPGIGFDKPIDFAKDDNGNIYITGTASSDGINYDIRTIKLDTDFDLVWDQSVDFAGNYDAGHTIELDDNGNVYVGGVSKSGLNIDQMCFVKYDASGTEEWKYTNAGSDVSYGASVKDVIVNSANEVYFFGDEMGKNGLEQAALMKLNADGQTVWHRKINLTPYDLTAVQVSFDTNENIYAVVNAQSGGSNNYEIAYFTEFEQDTNIVYENDTIPVFKDNELIVRFKQTAIENSAIDNTGGKIKEYDSLQYFLTSSAMTAFDIALQKECDSSLTVDNPCGIMAVKIFKRLPTTYDTTLSRMGEEIRVPDFWTTLLLVFPEHMEIETLYNDLKSIPDVVAFSEPNFIMQPAYIPNDYYYNDDQQSLYSDSLYPLYYPNAHINMQEAWKIYPESGAPFVRCGIFDDGILYKHEDFGYDSDDGDLSTKVRGGYDFLSSSDMFGTSMIVGENAVHGTPCAGIIGAIRNNTIGVAGIAGGDYLGNNNPFSPDYYDDKGVSLYSLRIFGLDENNVNYFVDNPIQSVYDAIVMSAIDEDTLDYGYGLHVSNHSWLISPNNTLWYSDSSYILLRDATQFANRAKVSMVAARGNNTDTDAAYPALMDDDWVTTVVGTGDDGKLKDKFNGANPDYTSNYGGIVDVGAPSSLELVKTTKADFNLKYTSFEGTSAAAPHVTGVISLLMSYLNDTLPNYDNLAPEDCEHILELAAVNHYENGTFNDSVGWGLIDAGATFQLIEKPWNTVHHFGSGSNLPEEAGYSTETLGATVELKEQVQNEANQWFDKGEYEVNVFRYDATVQHGGEIDGIDTVVAYWGRSSSTVYIEPIVNDTLLARERVQIDYLDKDSCVMHGFVYEFLDGAGNTLGWIPADTSHIRPKLEYTVLTRDSTAPVANIDEVKKAESFVNLYPNPTNELHTLELIGFGKEKVKIELYDIQGRKIDIIHEGKVSKKHDFQVDVSSLNVGVYLYRVISNHQRKTIRFIKQ